MKERIKPLGDKNFVGQTVTRLRKEQGMKQKELMARMQTLGVDINPSSLSKLEGQTRSVSDKELRALIEIFGSEISKLIF